MKNYNDIVNEPNLPTSLFDIGSLFGPPDLSRRLKPMRITAQKPQVDLLKSKINHKKFRVQENHNIV
jgi:hypothetical protein